MGGVFLNSDFPYAILPLNLIYDEKYSTLSSSEKLLYALLLNRTNYSRKNLKNFFDNKKGLFIYYTNEQIQKHLNCSSETVKKMLKNLENAGLIKKEYQKNGLPIKIYVTDLRENIEKPTTNYVASAKNVASVKKEKPTTNDATSFDIEKAVQQAKENRRNFGDKKNPKRHRT